jgi:hypothetical protein
VVWSDSTSTYQYSASVTQTANNPGPTVFDLVNALSPALEKHGCQKQ